MQHRTSRPAEQPPRWPVTVAGLLAANALPHLASAVTGRHHLTPLRGRDSGPGTNAAWGALNGAAAAALLRRDSGAGSPESDAGRWDRRLLAFGAGTAGMSLWMVASEAAWRVNSRP